MSEPKLHHFVPRFYLRRFANNKDQVAIRSRAGNCYVTSTRKALTRSGLYRVPGQPLTAEATLSGFEGLASDALKSVDAGNFPHPRTKIREALTLFGALQLTRHYDTMTMIEYYFEVIREVGDPPVDSDTVHQFLAKSYGFKPHENEVHALRDFANGALQMWPESRGAESALSRVRVQGLFEKALDDVAPMLDSRVWTLEVSRHERLITSDRPITLWNPPDLSDYYRGVGIAEAQEVWFILDRSKMLVLRQEGIERSKRIGPERVDMVNRHIARHCTQSILTHPSTQHLLHEVDLARRRPTVRFWRGPLVGPDEDDTVRALMHTWRPIRDIPDDVINPYTW